MTTPTRTRCRFNPHIQWFHPPINLVWSRMEDGTTPDEDDLATGIMPELWAMEVALTLDRIWNTDVGRSVMECVRKRTTIYPTDDGGQAYPDPYPDNPLAMTAGRGREEIAALAQTTGTRALIQFNPSTRVHRADGSTTRSPDATLLHELAHAVSITWGGLQRSRFYSHRARPSQRDFTGGRVRMGDR